MRFFALLALSGVLAGTALATAPPVGKIPPAKLTRITTTRGQLVSIALPRRAGGYVWRVARKFNPGVVRQVSEGEVGSTVVLVLKAVGKGRTAIVVAETRGETAKAYRAMLFDVTVR